MASRGMSAPPVLAGLNYVRPLGSGGFSDVFLYEQDMPRRVTAVKVLLSSSVTSETLRAFNAEADVTARLSAHPSIVSIYQASISADGRPYISMEYCPDSMRVRYKKGAVTLAEALDTGVRIAGALETAHRAGLLHRDIKPSNILISSMGTPVLADFGIAASYKDDTEIFAMSIPWSAPEVLSHATTGTIATEVWALGATIYTLICGRSPFESAQRTENTREKLIKRITQAKYVPIAGIPDAVNALLAATMSADPSARPASMAALGELLRSAQYQLGLAPTTFEAASAAWAGAEPVNMNDTMQRGPVISSVKTEAATARRERRGTSVSVDKDGVTHLTKAPSRWAPALIGALVTAGVFVVAGVVLIATGVIG